uniref:C-type lectin domain-containing protein n=1 Tax=Globodera pallida TaxID=36090 RepID=A0A183CLM0_GLOPA
MYSAKFEWKIVAESELWLTQPCASVVSQLFQIWWRLCASVNRRIACTRFLNEQNAPLELLNEIVANLSPISADLESKLWRGSDIMQIIPKSHFHKTFSDRCFEVAEFGGDGQKGQSKWFVDGIQCREASICSSGRMRWAGAMECHRI